MKVDGTGSGKVIQSTQLGMGQQGDAVSRDLQRKIEDAQKRLHEVSSDKEMGAEEKSKKRQEIQKQISGLQNELRQHQIRQRQEMSAGKTASDGSTEKAGKGNGGKGRKGGKGKSGAGMAALLSADAAAQRAQIQGSAAAKLEGKANVLEAEIKQDAATGGDTSKKEEELADVKAMAEHASSEQMETLKEANGTLQEAAGAQEEDTVRRTPEAEEKADKKDKKSDTEDKETENGEKRKAKQTGEAEKGASIDIRL